MNGLRTSILMAGFASVGFLVYAVASAPTNQPDLLGIRGLKRIRAVSANATFARFEPLLRWTGTQLGRVLSDKTCAQLDRQLALAGDFLGLRAEEFVALCGLFGLAGLLFGLGMSNAFDQPPEMVLGTALLAMCLPYTRLTSLQEQRRRRATHGLPPVVDLLVLCLSAGLDFPGAVRHVVAKASNPSDAFIEELGFLLQELNVGKTRKAALTQLAERLPTDSMREFVAAVIQAEEHGNPLARVLQIHAEVSRQQRSVRAEEAAAKAGAKMMLPIAMVFGALLILIGAPLVRAMS